jgi:hypothetical protein
VSAFVTPGVTQGLTDNGDGTYTQAYTSVAMNFSIEVFIDNEKINNATNYLVLEL